MGKSRYKKPTTGPITPDEIEEMKEEAGYEASTKRPKYLNKWHKRRMIGLPCPTCGAEFGRCRVMPKRIVKRRKKK